jgi:SPP1 family predicted phage head-tail adaptor
MAFMEPRKPNVASSITMRIGRLRKRMVLQVNSPTQRLSNGENVDNWQPVTGNVTTSTVYAGIEPMTGREYWNAVQVQSDITHKITLRYRGDIALTADMRGVIGGRVFHFASQPRNIDERDAKWEVLAIEWVQDEAT